MSEDNPKAPKFLVTSMMTSACTPYIVYTRKNT
jgi:hypothetical protein